jgi:LPXTG-site transpeptidase (sortase) family protein
VALVEANYQYQSFLKNRLHLTSLKALLIPNFVDIDLKARTAHKAYGIVIPKLFIDEPVIFNIDPNDEKAYLAALKQGIAQASGTAFPDQPGLGYYFAHSSRPDFHIQYNAVFYLLNKLDTKDDIYIWHENKRFHYQVTQKYLTQPNDLSFLHKEYDQETIVLQTCWPPGTSLQRLLVFASRVPDETK